MKKQDLARECKKNYDEQRRRYELGLIDEDDINLQQALLTCADCYNDDCIRCERPEMWIEDWELYKKEG